jgi:hypothetical protein
MGGVVTRRAPQQQCEAAVEILSEALWELLLRRHSQHAPHVMKLHQEESAHG